MKKIQIIGAIIVIVVVAVFAFIFTRGSSSPQQVSNLDAIDTTGSFYGQWLKAAQEPKTANPTKATLAKLPILSKTLSARLVSALNDSSTTLDPVLCQTIIPTNITTRNVYEEANKAQELITSKDKTMTNQAIVSLLKSNNGWYIDDIQCSSGETAPVKQFSFENEGYLLKGSVPPPYNSKNWHLVFDKDGVAGNVVPLFFNSESQCVGTDGIKSTCKPDQFKETTKVSVHGQMTESGVTVNLLELVK